MTISFEEFKATVIADLKQQWKSDMIHGFRNFDEEGRGGRGFEFQVPILWGAYVYCDNEWTYHGNRGVWGRGATLQEAQTAEAEKYDAGFEMQQVTR